MRHVDGNEKQLQKADKILTNEPNNTPGKSQVERMKDLAMETKKSSRALFSGETAQKILNHELKYKMEE